jgi:hypothetical protein
MPAVFLLPKQSGDFTWSCKLINGLKVKLQPINANFPLKIKKYLKTFNQNIKCFPTFAVQKLKVCNAYYSAISS